MGGHIHRRFPGWSRGPRGAPLPSKRSDLRATETRLGVGTSPTQGRTDPRFQERRLRSVMAPPASPQRLRIASDSSSGAQSTTWKGTTARPGDATTHPTRSAEHYVAAACAIVRTSTPSSEPAASTRTSPGSDTRITIPTPGREPIHCRQTFVEGGPVLTKVLRKLQCGGRSRRRGFRACAFFGPRAVSVPFGRHPASPPPP